MEWFNNLWKNNIGFRVLFIGWNALCIVFQIFISWYDSEVLGELVTYEVLIIGGIVDVIWLLIAYLFRNNR